ncbi:hypothetical protein NFI96_009303 [Prochilodus magdalenae]|nr:hypothetical protein NFI96_009303 [Prochilodus magdalenae]
MGCSPSKGQLFTGASAHKALQPGSQGPSGGNLSDGTETQSKTETDIVSAGLTILEDEPLQGKGFSLCDAVCDTTGDRGDVDVETKLDPQEVLPAQDKENVKAERRKKSRGSKRSKQKERVRKPAHVQPKVDLPEKMVRAHQAAYAYLNQNIPKYESLLGLLDQATQTQLSLQPTVALLALRYEEINQALEEMAVEGEQVLEEHGKHMAWPAALKEVQVNPVKPDAELYSPEPPPDLLQQMLQHSAEKMRLVGDSVKGLGDAALEEATDYFASLSQLLGEKLVVKRATEGRLKQVLDRVEAAALRKSNLEDSALHSEDSGIGGDNECQNGSGRLRSHRESSGSGASTGSSSGCLENTVSAQAHLTGVEEDRDDDDDDNEDDDDSEEDSSEEEEAKDERRGATAATQRKMSTCSSKYDPQNGKPTNRTLKPSEQRDTNLRRPKTAGSPSVPSQQNPKHSSVPRARRARSADCLYFKMDEGVKEQEKRQRDNQKPETGVVGGEGCGSLGRTRLRRHSLEGQSTARCYGLQYGSKGPFKATLPPGSPPALVPAPPGRNAVKRLINTFSQGVQEKSHQQPLNGPMKGRGPKRGFLPVLANSTKGVSTNGNNNNNSFQRFPERPDDVDVDSLPPPPLEVLMDNSFESNEGPPGDEEGTESLHQSCSTRRQRSSVSQRLRASLQMGTVLPSRATVPRRSQSISPARPIRQDAVVGSRQGQDCDQPTGDDTEREEAASLYQQSRKVIHLRHSSDSPAQAGPGILRGESVARQGSKDSGEAETLMPYPNTCPPTTPPVSRTRLPPSCPSVCHRIPSPPALPCVQGGTRPSSPNVQRWTRRTSEEENGTSSLSFNDARSVFCIQTPPAPQSLTPSCRSTLPRPWGEPSRGRLQTTRLHQSLVKSSSSGVRPTVPEQQQPLDSATQPSSPDSERVIQYTEEQMDYSLDLYTYRVSCTPDLFGWTREELRVRESEYEFHLALSDFVEGPVCMPPLAQLL